MILFIEVNLQKKGDKKSSRENVQFASMVTVRAVKIAFFHISSTFRDIWE